MNKTPSWGINSPWTILIVILGKKRSQRVNFKTQLESYFIATLIEKITTRYGPQSFN